MSDAKGRRLTASGVEHAKSGDEPTAHRLRVLLLDEGGRGEERHEVVHFRTPVYDHTVAARDAAVVRYAWTLPEKLGEDAFPLKIRVRLRHRRLATAIHRSTCRDMETERAKALADATQKVLGVRPDPCVELPIVDMAKAEATVATDSFTLPERDAWQRWYERGLGLQDHLSERLGEAHDSFDRALDAIGEHRDDRRRAMALVGKAQVYARQGSYQKAIELFDRAQELVGEHPALYYGRGKASARVWRFDRAVAEFEAASKLADDDRVLRKLAQGQGSLSRPIDSLISARKGLVLEPRDADLLRSQWVALRALGVPDAWVEAAAQAYDQFKHDEDAHHIQARCAELSEICRKERIKVHTHELE